jgi:hypothetical protein
MLRIFQWLPFKNSMKTGKSKKLMRHTTVEDVKTYYESVFELEII